jgi:hypothetical protein
MDNWRFPISTSDVYRQALAKHDWAEQHIDKLNAVLVSWRQVNPCTTVVKKNAETGDVTYCVDYVPAVPVEVSLIIGDVLHSLRGALDYIACGMVVAGGGKITSKTKFPIRKVATDWEVSGLRLVDGAHQLAIEALRRIQPYQTGNSFLWTLNQMNNIDKHHLLLTASLVDFGRTVGPNEEAAQIEASIPGFITNTKIGLARIRYRTTPVLPLHTGQELLTLPASQAQEDMCFFMDVAISETGFAEGTPAVMLLRMISTAVSSTIRDLARFV